MHISVSMRRRVLAAGAVFGLALGAVASAAPASASPGSTGAHRGHSLAVLTGGQEVAPADPAGRGFAVVQVGRHNRVCYALSAWGLAGTVTGAHIHQAPVGKNGPVKVTLQPPVHGGSVGCSTVAGALARALRSHPADFYVNVHTSAFPDGAVRGQLHG